MGDGFATYSDVREHDKMKGCGAALHYQTFV